MIQPIELLNDERRVAEKSRDDELQENELLEEEEKVEDEPCEQPPPETSCSPRIDCHAEEEKERRPSLEEEKEQNGKESSVCPEEGTPECTGSTS